MKSTEIPNDKKRENKYHTWTSVEETWRPCLFWIFLWVLYWILRMLLKKVTDICISKLYKLLSLWISYIYQAHSRRLNAWIHMICKKIGNFVNKEQFHQSLWGHFNANPSNSWFVDPYDFVFWQIPSANDIRWLAYQDSMHVW